MSKRILLIDSDETFARSLQGSLEGRGLGVLMATNSEQGMALAKSESPDLIVVCVEAQPTNGYMLCTRLKKDDQLKLVPVVLTSANATPDSFEKHKKLKTRAEEYLIKPFEPAALLHRIGALLRIEIPAAPAAPHEEIVSMEDEPLGLGDLVGEDEPVHLTDSEAAEAHAGTPPPSSELELDTVDVEEVLSEVSIDEQQGHASDEDLDMLDAAFDALSPASRPITLSTDRTAIDIDPGHQAEAASASHEVTTGPVQTAQDAGHPEASAALEARVRELEEQLAAKDAELEAAKKGQSSAAELRKLKEARSKADKENVRLKEELNEKEKELIELRDQQSTLEHQAQTLEDDAVKREVAAKALQQRAEALAAAAKKFERELGAAREELKSVAALKTRISELEKTESAHQELQKAHSALQGELELNKEEAAEHAAEASHHRDLAAKLEAQLSAAKAQHESELQQAREQHHGEAEELRAQLEQHKDSAKKLEEELASAKAQHAEAASAAEGELSLAREAREKTRSELQAARAAAENAESAHAETKAAVEKAQAELAAAKEEARRLHDELAELQLAAEQHQGELQSAKEAGEKLRADVAQAQTDVARAHEELEKAQLELAGAQEQVETARAEAEAAAGEKHLISDERDELRRQLDEANAAAARNEQRAVQAYQRIKGDEKLREKTKKALQIALQLLDEVQSLPDEPIADETPIIEQSA